MTFKYNTRQFIREMHSRPCLWDINSAEYQNRVRKESAWQEIAQQMYDEWADLPSNEKTVKVKELQKKWKGLRDYYTREKNKRMLNNGNETRRIRKSPFLDMLSFLNFKKKKVPNRSHQSEDSFSGNSLEVEQQSPANSPVVIPRRATARTVSPQQNSQEETERLNNDPDTNFLFSILPDMKSMSRAQNFEFRFQVMALLKNIKYNQQNTDFYLYTAPGTSSFVPEVNLIPKYKSGLRRVEEVDPISNESPVNSPEDVKVSIEVSPCSSPSH